MGTPCVAVAYSGGRDSTALLHVTVRAAAALGIEVVALHVHHGLHIDADAWLEHCEHQCATWAARGLPIRLLTHRVQAKPPRGASVEAWARGERYRALDAMAHRAGATIVLLAQHRRDQAETFLLQALRGAGVAGLAAMPARRSRDHLEWVRPWLHRSRQSIEHYLRRHRLHYVDDGSNVDPRFARNRLRAQVWPVLERAFPSAEAALADAARWSAQASALLNEIARADLAQLVGPGGLDLERWRVLSPARGRNVLRHWLADAGIFSAALLERLGVELIADRPARWQVDAGVELRAYRGRLRLERRGNAVSTRDNATLAIGGAGRYALDGWGGCVVVRVARAGGVEPGVVESLRVARRQGGERFALSTDVTPRSLKKQFQALGVAAWLREGPLLWSGNRLLYVPGLGVDARIRAAPGTRQYTIEWAPDDEMLHRSS